MLEKLKKELRTAWNPPLRLPKVDQQYVIIADATFYSAAYVRMIEDYTTNRDHSELSFAPFSFGSRSLHPKLSIYAKNSLQFFLT